MILFLTGCATSCSQQRNSEEKSTENMQRYEKTVHKNSDGTGFVEEKITQQVTTGTIVVQQTIDYKLPAIDAILNEDSGMDGLLNGLLGFLPGGGIAIILLKRLLSASTALKKTETTLENVVGAVEAVPENAPKKDILAEASRRMNRDEKLLVRDLKKRLPKE
jgi:hypothetical protein